MKKPKPKLNHTAVQISGPGPKINSGNQSMIFMRFQDSHGASYLAKVLKNLKYEFERRKKKT